MDELAQNLHVGDHIRIPMTNGRVIEGDIESISEGLGTTQIGVRDAGGKLKAISVVLHRRPAKPHTTPDSTNP